MRAHVRRGFTLLEVLVALVVTGLVVTVAYASVQGGLEAKQRLTTHAATAEAAVTVRATLRDALRHALPGVPGGPPVFTLQHRLAPDGRPSDSLAFLTRGVLPPYGTSTAWQVSVSVNADGLHVAAFPEGATGAVPIHADVPGITSFEVQAIGRGTVAAWQAGWPDAGVAPQAVMLAMSDGRSAAVPLVARLSLERVP